MDVYNAIIHVHVWLVLADKKNILNIHLFVISVTRVTGDSEEL